MTFHSNEAFCGSYLALECCSAALVPACVTLAECAASHPHEVAAPDAWVD